MLRILCAIVGFGSVFLNGIYEQQAKRRRGRPTVRRMQVLMEEMIATGPSQAGSPPQAAAMEQLGKRLGIIGPSLDLTVVFKPGGPSL